MRGKRFAEKAGMGAQPYGAWALQRTDAIPRKAAPDQPSSAPRSLRPHREAGSGPTRSPGASETLTRGGRSLSTRTVGRGGCSPGVSRVYFHPSRLYLEDRNSLGICVCRADGRS
jgi:hypothetical protein